MNKKKGTRIWIVEQRYRHRDSESAYFSTPVKAKKYLEQTYPYAKESTTLDERTLFKGPNNQIVWLYPGDLK